MRIICFGDSLTTCGGAEGRYSDLLAERFPGHEVINAGKGGETWEEAMQRLETDVLARRPDIVLLEYGANDWQRGTRQPSEWADDLRECVLRILDAGAIPVILGVFGKYFEHATGSWQEKTYGADERSREYRELERAVAECTGCPYLPNIQSDIIDDRTCWHDRNHPNEHGNRRVTAQIAPVITKLTGTAPNDARTRRMTTLADFWEEAVTCNPDCLAAVCGEERLTYREADAKCASLARGLRDAAAKDAPVAPVVAVCLPNCMAYYLVYWAVVKLGGVIVPINPWLKAESLDAILDCVRPDLVILSGPGDRELTGSLAHHPGLPAYALEGAPYRPYSGLFASGGVPESHPEPGRAAIVMHTSGTTSAPKGAIMRHSDLIFNVMTTINAQGFVPSDIHLLVNPMFHCTALYSSLPAAAYQKSAVVITADTRAEGLLTLIEREHVTTCLTVPSILQRITALPGIGRWDLRSLRVIGYAGSFMPVKTVRRLQELFPDVVLHNFFGLTETISATHVLGGKDSLERPDSIGETLPFVYCRITAEDGHECAPGEVGELLFERSNVIVGYWGKPGKLEESLTELDGRTWFRTGDLAMKDEEGFFFIKGRKKDMIIVGGENVFASEVEAALMQLDTVREAAVIGIPATGVRESLGELIKAFVVPEPGTTLTETDIRRHCRKILPSYKNPHVIAFLDALPRNPAGKVMKQQLA